MVVKNRHIPPLLYAGADNAADHLPEEFFEKLFYPGDFNNFDGMGRVIDPFVERRNEYSGKPEPVGFPNALFDAADRPDLSGKTYFPRESGMMVNGQVEVGREDTGQDRQVGSGVADFHASGDI